MRRPRGFTILELLIIVGIMVALSTMLLPSYNRIRGLTKRTRCASNLKQLIIGVNTYAGNNNGFLPPHKLDASATRWWGYDSVSRADGSWPEGEIFGYVREEEAFQCPSVVSGEQADGGAPLEWAFTARDVGYGYNAFFLGWYGGDPTAIPSAEKDGIRPDKWCNRSYINDAYRTIVFADSTVRGDGVAADRRGSFAMWWPNATTTTPAGAYARHLDDTANLAMLDGGVLAKTNDEMYDATSGAALAKWWDPRYEMP